MQQSIIILYMAFIICLVNAKYEEDYLQASDKCLRLGELGNDYKQKFDVFDFPDESSVHTFVHCVWQNMGLWEDDKGFNIARIADLYKDRANADIVVPILTQCNRNENIVLRLPELLSYYGFTCMLDSRVGQWFKDDVNAQKKDNDYYPTFV